jgi:peptidoglycan/LPS O-acetylase OafA/YrhL
MVRKIAFGMLWLGFSTYAFFFAPPNQPDTFELIKNLSTGNWQGINPLIVALFNIMGIWPIIYSCLVLIDGREQKIPAWIFASASFAVGAFALLPYLALRDPNQKFSGKKNLLLSLLDSRLTGIALAVGTAIIVAYGVGEGDWGNFVQQWQTSRFIHVMSLDFCLLCLLFPALLGDDMARRDMNNPQLFWLIAFIPLFGPLMYLCMRPPLQEPSEEMIQQQQPARN